MKHLPNHDVHARVLKYDPKRGPVEEVAREGLDAELDHGFYRPVGNRIAGVCGSPDGPVFFYDEHRFPLNDDAELSVEQAGDDRVFVLKTKGRERLRIRYTPPVSGFDAWSADESMTDFFTWLVEHFPGGRMQNVYTES